MKKVYKDFSIEKCLESAASEFEIPIEKLEYELLSEKKFLFKKTVEVEIYIPEEYTKKDYVNTKDEVPEIDENDGTIKIVDGNIVVKNPKDGGRPAFIVVGQNVKAAVDGIPVKSTIDVFEESKIEVSFEQNIAARELKIHLSDNEMEAYANVIYKPKNLYKLIDKQESNTVVLENEIEAQIDPPKYNIDDIKKELVQNSVVYGIIEENLKKCVENSCDKILVAKGQETEDGKDDTIEIKFKIDSDTKNLKEDGRGNIDFRSIGSIESVLKGDIVAMKHAGTDGQDGCSITGKVKKHKPGKKLGLKIGTGCSVKDENIVIAAIDGKPCIRNGTFYVYPVHEVRSDVDLKTGNIKFIGDVIVYGNVREAMEIECGNSLSIEMSVERAKIKAKGDISIRGNVITSSIFGGGEDVEKIRILKYLEQLKETLNNLVKAVEEIKKYNLLGQDRKDGEIIKLLIENKFKIIPRLCMNVIATLKIQQQKDFEEKLLELIKNKLLGMGPISIRHYSELDLITNSMEERISLLKSALSVPVSVKISYCQDSSIQSSGDIIISGKGEYISDINANGNIYFIQEKSVARGGILKAKNEIKCRIVGSAAGVSTRLQVDKYGHIWVDEAYQNTVFIVGNKEYILDKPSRNIHAYLDNNEDIIVDKFLL